MTLDELQILLNEVLCEENALRDSLEEKNLELNRLLCRKQKIINQLQRTVAQKNFNDVFETLNGKKVSTH